jgi:hypothetical protein
MLPQLYDQALQWGAQVEAAVPFFVAFDWKTLIFCYFVICCAVHLSFGIVSSVLVPSVYNNFVHPKPKAGATEADARRYIYKTQVNWNIDLTSIISCFILSTLHTVTVYRCFVVPGNTIEEHWGLITLSSTHGHALQIGMSLYELVAYMLAGKSAEFYLHHVLVIAVFGYTLILGRGHGWIAWCGLVEWTNVPLCIMTVLGRTSLRNGILHKLAAFVLWIFYVVCRLIAPPLCYYVKYGELFDSTNASATWISKDDTLNKAWLILLFLTWVIIQGLSCYWFYLISKGILKGLGMGGGGNKKGKKA